MVAALTEVFQEVGVPMKASTYSLLAASLGSVGGRSPVRVPPLRVAMPSVMVVMVTELGGCMTMVPDRLAPSIAAEGLMVGGLGPRKPSGAQRLIIVTR